MGPRKPGAAKLYTTSLFLPVRSSELKLSYRPLKISQPVNNSREACLFFRKIWDKGLIELQEQVNVIFLNNNNEVISWHCYNTGKCDETIIDVKLIVGCALIIQACNVIIAHNHPSGSLVPSPGDRTVTKKLYRALELIDINLVDHLILTRSEYLSFVDNDIKLT